MIVIPFINTVNYIRLRSLLNQINPPTDLALTVLNDTSIKLDWTVNSLDRDGHKIERSTDGITYAEIGSVLGATATYTDTTGLDGTRYYYRVRAYKGTSYSAYSNVANDWTAIKMVLTSTGTGAGVSTVRFWFGADVVVTLDGTGKWYSNSGGTTDESASYTFTGGSLQTRYLKVTSGVSNMLLFAKGNWKQWGDLVYNPITGVLTTDLNGFISSTNAATIAKDISTLTTLVKLFVTGSNTLSGSVAGLTNLTYMRVEGSNTLSGDIGKVGATAMVEGITEIHLGTTNQMNTYTSGAIWSLTNSSDINPAAGYGYDSTEIDNMLIDMAASLGTVVNKTITLKGSSAARTSASDAAVTTLDGKGWTVVTN